MRPNRIGERGTESSYPLYSQGRCQRLGGVREPRRTAVIAQ
jgi:hypothetical protein